MKTRTIKDVKGRLHRIMRSLVVITSHVSDNATPVEFHQLDVLAFTLEKALRGQGPVFGALPRERDWMDDVIRQQLLNHLGDEDVRFGLLELVAENEQFGGGVEASEASQEELKPVQDRIDEALDSVVDYVKIAV